MDRIYVVAVGGNGDQPVQGKYVGTDGAQAQAIFDEEGQDGANEIVRLFPFPEHSQIRTPKRDSVPPRPRPAASAIVVTEVPSTPVQTSAQPVGAPTDGDGVSPYTGLRWEAPAPAATEQKPALENRESFVARIAKAGRDILSVEAEKVGFTIPVGISNADLRVKLADAKFPPTPAANGDRKETAGS